MPPPTQFDNVFQTENVSLPLDIADI